MGGGTGTGAAPVIARMAKERGILTVGVVTKPFGFEGSRRARAADDGIAELQQYVDTLIVIPNQNLFHMANERTTWKEAFQMADQVLYMGVRGVTDLMMVHGQINLDFNDIKTVMAEMGKAMMGTGESDGEGRATRAAEAAISNPLLEETSMAGARGLLINITGGDDLTLFEVDEAVSTVRKQVDDDANVLFGSATDESLEGRIRVSVVATGIDGPRSQEQPRPKLVAVGGGTPFPEPRPIPMPVMGTAPMHSSDPLAHQTSNITSLRQQTAQQERSVIPDPLPYPDDAILGQWRAAHADAASAVPVTRQPSSLFAAGSTTAEPSLAQGDSVARSLFQSATGLFRKRAVSSQTHEMPVRRHEEPTMRMGQPGELVMEAERPMERRAMAVDESALDIPAFLRRQSS
jgi:cell division protein FtsZ